VYAADGCLFLYISTIMFYEDVDWRTVLLLNSVYMSILVILRTAAKSDVLGLNSQISD
jgi:hypothetical protein